MSHTYNPFDPDYLDARQRERDEHVLGLTDQAGNTPWNSQSIDDART